jgi:hypothetical protein
MLSFICSKCGGFGQAPTDSIDSGTSLTCRECGGETVVELHSLEHYKYIHDIEASLPKIEKNREHISELYLDAKEKLAQTELQVRDLRIDISTLKATTASDATQISSLFDKLTAANLQKDHNFEVAEQYRKDFEEASAERDAALLQAEELNVLLKSKDEMLCSVMKAKDHWLDRANAGELQNRELLQQLKYVWMLAERMHPTKAHNTHREEALQMWRGTLDDASAVIKKTMQTVNPKSEVRIGGGTKICNKCKRLPGDCKCAENSIPETRIARELSEVMEIGDIMKRRDEAILQVEEMRKAIDHLGITIVSDSHSIISARVHAALDGLLKFQTDKSYRQPKEKDINGMLCDMHPNGCPDPSHKFVEKPKPVIEGCEESITSMGYVRCNQKMPCSIHGEKPEGQNG